MIENVIDNTNLRLALQGGIIPRILRLSEKWNLKLFRRRTIYRLTEDYQEEFGFTPYQKTKGLIRLLDAVKPERVEILKADLFARLNERQRLRLSFGVWLKRFFDKVGEVTALVVTDKRNELRLKLAELGGLCEVEWV